MLDSLVLIVLPLCPHAHSSASDPPVTPHLYIVPHNIMTWIPILQLKTFPSWGPLSCCLVTVIVNAQRCLADTDATFHDQDGESKFHRITNMMLYPPPNCCTWQISVICVLYHRH
ncbi:hypothetical protein P152DRAFT_258858 [Eremomyces bilateralis CBS 781.70]|uniref:Secreted protein n=1 Tax=Eremomyces bilateralis CBS 781.70 TaxID=1392243 RepID=A0A6G1FQN0_9PEZI|nr:uncharacterized protein P152DRAFT_258858 [Eremomyces bilateralis CBS 781.70]KAF1808038.1 hypothetical protein P152DRAFT_258858 [Eremomyces bilateralis CBS 781.70]